MTARGTNLVSEIRAGTTSFLTLSYLLLVNPQIMVQAGVAHDDAVFATALSASIACLTVGIGGNLPFGCAPGLGPSASPHVSSLLVCLVDVQLGNLGA